MIGTLSFNHISEQRVFKAPRAGRLYMNACWLVATTSGIVLGIHSASTPLKVILPKTSMTWILG